LEQSSYSDYNDFAWFYNKYWSRAYSDQVFPTLEKLLLSRLSLQSHILDLCCGTGQLTQALIERGFQVTGIDSSAGMLHYARENAPGAEFILADVRSFSLPAAYHAVFSTFNSLNHMTTLEELKAVFKNVHKVLLEGGIFLFDVIMEEGCRFNWQDSFSLVKDDNVCIVQASYNPDERLGQGNITLFRLEGKNWQRSDVTLFQRSYPESEIRSALVGAGFSQVSTYDAIKDLGMTGHIGRMFFLADN
jgi:SAM-dependent methyltransferase